MRKFSGELERKSMNVSRYSPALIAVNLPVWMLRKLLCVHQYIRDPKSVLLAKVSHIFDIWAGINVRRYLSTCD